MGDVSRRIVVQASSGKTVTPYPKVAKVKQGSDVAQVAEHLPGKCETLNPNPSTTNVLTL
jgi:hypothetical protein